MEEKNQQINLRSYKTQPYSQISCCQNYIQLKDSAKDSTRIILKHVSSCFAFLDFSRSPCIILSKYYERAKFIIIILLFLSNPIHPYLLASDTKFYYDLSFNICNKMQQFKFEDNQVDLSCLQHYSSEELSLLNSRRRHNDDVSQRSSQIQRQNEEQMTEFKREIQERYKISICNKIYTFPRIIKSFYDIVSSEEEDTSTNQQMKFNDRNKINQFKKKDKNVFQHSKNKANSKYTNQLQQNPSKVFDSAKIGKDKLKTNESTGKRKDEEVKQKVKILKIDKTASGKKEKKKTERLKTEHQGSGSFLQTLRSKPGKKN